MRRVLVGSSLLVLVLAVLAVTAGCGGGSGPSSAASDPAGVGAGGTASTTPAPSESESASAGSSATASATVTPKPLHTTSSAHATPWTDKNADFGFVTRARDVGGRVEFSFDRATWLLPDQIPAWNKANPGHQVEAADDYAIGNVSTRLRTFVLRPKAKIFGSILLSGDVAPAAISAADFVAKIEAMGKIGVTCWIYHQYGGLTGDVIQLEEQYRP